MVPCIHKYIYILTDQKYCRILIYFKYKHLNNYIYISNGIDIFQKIYIKIKNI